MKMTSYNLKTVGRIVAYQAECDALMARFSLLRPDLQAPVVLYKTKAKCCVENFSFIYVDNMKDVFIPAVRVDLKVHEVVVSQHGESKVCANVEVTASYNNSRTAKWEPFVEPLNVYFVMETRQNATVVSVTAGSSESLADGLYINFTEELLETALSCLENYNNDTSMKEISAEDDAIIYDSQFLVRNKLGYEFSIKTVCDREGPITKVKSMGEKFVNFIITDEFSTKDASRKEIVLSLDEQVLERVDVRSEELQDNFVRFSVDKVMQVERKINGETIVVTIKKEKMKRVIVVSSKILINNKTTHPLTYLLFSPEGVAEDIAEIPPGLIWPIKHNRIEGLIILGIGESLSKSIILPGLLDNKSRQPLRVEVPLACPSNKFNLLQLTMLKKNKLVYLEINPVLRIVNACPVEIDYYLVSSSYCENSRIAKSGFVEFYSHDPNKQASMIAIQLGPNRCEVDLTKLLKSEGASKLYLSNTEKKDAYKGYLEVFHDKSGGEVIFFMRNVMVNEYGPGIEIFEGGIKLVACEPGSNVYLPTDKKGKRFEIRANESTFGERKVDLAKVGRVAVEKKVTYARREELAYKYLEVQGSVLLALVPTEITTHKHAQVSLLAIMPAHVLINDTDWGLSIIQDKRGRLV